MYKTVKPTTFTLPLDILDNLNIMAKSLDKKKTTIVVEALEMYMDYQDLQEAQFRIKNNKNVLNNNEFWKKVKTNKK